MFYITLIIWLILDWVTKYVAQDYFTPTCLLESCKIKALPIVWDNIYLDLAYNSWIAFGIKVPFWLLKTWTIALIIWIYYYYREELKQEKDTKKQNILQVSFWLILAWAIWNWVERVVNERVIDFIWVKYFSIFNLADSFISIWALFLIYYYYNKK